MAAEYATIRDVAAHFRVSVSTVRNWIRANTVSPDTYIKINGTYRFNLDLVEAALLRASKTNDDQNS
jgi:DNA-binding LacI/PurR family transcriptional regulator